MVKAQEARSGVSAASPDDAAFVAKFPKAWLLRQCRVYDEELSACKSVRARLSQYYVDGKVSDCKNWKDNADDCRKWMGDRDEEALVSKPTTTKLSL